MQVLTLGPLVLPLSKIPALIALIVLLLTSELFNKRYPGLARWGWLCALVATLTSRLFYAAGAPSAYIHEPWTLLYFWQPGFSLAGALIGGLLFTVWYLRRQPPVLIRGFTIFGLSSFLGLALLFLTPGTQFTQEQLPELTFTDINNQEQTLSDFTGTPVIVNLWATWCPPCRREMPMLHSYINDPRLNIVLINQGESLVKVDQFLRSQKLEFPYLFLDNFHTASRHFNAQGLPATLFYNAQGQLVDRHFGELSRAQIERFIQQYSTESQN